jgi:cell division protein FtsB
VPDPGESAEKRGELAALVEVEPRVLPAGLLPSEWGFLPRRVVTMRAASLAAFVDPRGETTGWVLRPPLTGYDLEEAALEEAHRTFRDLPHEAVRWDSLPVEPVPPEEALVEAQRRHTRDVAALRAQVADLEQQLTAMTELAEERMVHIGEIGRSLRQHDPVMRSMNARIEHLERQNAKLRASRARLRRRLRALGQEPAAPASGLRRLLRRFGGR